MNEPLISAVIAALVSVVAALLAIFLTPRLRTTFGGGNGLQSCALRSPIRSRSAPSEA